MAPFGGSIGWRWSKRHGAWRETGSRKKQEERSGKWETGRQWAVGREDRGWKIEGEREKESEGQSRAACPPWEGSLRLSCNRRLLSPASRRKKRTAIRERRRAAGRSSCWNRTVLWYGSACLRLRLRRGTPEARRGKSGPCLRLGKPRLRPCPAYLRKESLRVRVSPGMGGTQAAW